MIITGIILIASGIIFTIQSYSIIGPSSSFMYNNPEWTNNGFVIIVIGIIIVIIGIYYSKSRKKKELDD